MNRTELKDRLEKFCHDIEINISCIKADLEELENDIADYGEGSDHTTADMLTLDSNFRRIRIIATEASEMIRRTK